MSAGKERMIALGGRVDGNRWLWPLLGFFTVWIGGTTAMSARLASLALVATPDPRSTLVPVLFSFFFLFATCAAIHLVLFAARADREEVQVGFEPELDHDELRLRWRPARPSLLRLLWTFVLVAAPLAVGLSVVLSGLALVPTALGVGYLGVLAALEAFGGAVAWSVVAREVLAFDRYRLDVRGGQMAVTVEGPLRSRRQVWSLATARVRSGHASLVVEDPVGTRRIPLPTAAGDLEQLASWLALARTGDGGLPAPPPALARLRGRAPLEGRRR